MESLLYRRLQVIAALTLVCSSVSLAPARAEEPPYEYPVNVTVDSNPDAVVVDAEAEKHDAGGTGTQASGPSGPRCYLKGLTASEFDDYVETQYWGYRMQKEPFNMFCDGEWRSIVWVDIPDDGSNGTPPSTDPEDVAMHLRDEMPIPRVTVEINPGRGLVGAESWYWIDGYDGAVVTNATDAFGSLVEVEARVTRYEWSFGDGTTVSSESPGRAYPARSQIRHLYERSSAGLPDGYPVDVTFVFAVRYRVDGGSWIELPGITRTAHADYPVRESQAVIDR